MGVSANRQFSDEVAAYLNRGFGLEGLPWDLPRILADGDTMFDKPSIESTIVAYGYIACAS